MGGPHVANQAHKVFTTCSAVDVVVNGEGERVFLNLLRARSRGLEVEELPAVRGISFRSQDGSVTTTAEEPRIEVLDEIPSPFLTGALHMFDQAGNFRFDVALMETNRGCPYKCAFCYWGGAIGQKVRSFSRERLREEIEFFARRGVHDIVLCDANFGMLGQDESFVEDLIKARERFGFPRNLEASWAKNKSKTFRGIVRKMKDAKFKSTFTLALQTLNDNALVAMQRKNMKLNAWEELAAWLKSEGLECYAELIWGAPGETYESFLEGYDRLADHVSRIATYPMLLIPNTEYSENRERHGFVAIEGEKDDFDYVLSHRTMTIEDNEKMHRFLFWARTIAENSIFRLVWKPLRRVAGLSQATVLLSLDRWVDQQTCPGSSELRRHRQKMVDALDASLVGDALRCFYASASVNEALARWWESEILPWVPETQRLFFAELFRFDQCCRPVLLVNERVVWHAGFGENRTLREMEFRVVNKQNYLVLRDCTFSCDVSRGLEELERTHSLSEKTLAPLTMDLYYRVGFGGFIDNHEFAPAFRGKTREEILKEDSSDAVLMPQSIPRRSSVVESERTL